MLDFVYVLLSIAFKIGAFILLSKVGWQLWWNRPGCEGRDVPGDMGWPIIGDTLVFFFEGPRAYLRKRFLKYGPVFKTHLTGRPHCFFQSSEDIKKCLLGEERIVQSLLPKPMHILLGQDSILGQHGDEHYQNRTVLLRCVTAPGIQNLLDIMQPYLDGLIKSWIDECNGSKSVDVYPGIAKSVFVLSQSLVFGHFDHEVNERIEKYFHIVDGGSFSVPVDLPFTAFGKALVAKRKLRVELMKNVQARVKELSESNAPGTGYLDMLLEQRLERGVDSDPNYEKLLSQLVLGVSAPVLTTSSGLCIIFNALAQMPDLIQRLRQEQIGLIGDDRVMKQLDIATLKSLPLLDSALREILRQLPIAMGLFRISIKPFTTDNGTEIPAGWGVGLALDSCMTQFSKIMDVEQFMPERFLKSTEKEYQPGQYECIFFGGGARRCPGQELALLTIKMFVTLMVHNSDFSHATGHPIVLNDFPAPLPTAETPLRLIFSSRF